MRIRFFLAAVLLSLLAGCSAPPPQARTVSFVKSLEMFIQSDEKPGSLLDLFYSFRKLSDVNDLVTYLRKGDVISMSGVPVAPKDNTLIYTTGGNGIAVHRNICITCDKKYRIFYSFDGENWYPLANNKRKGEENIEYDFSLHPRLSDEDRNLNIDFKWMAGKAVSPRPVKMKKKETAWLKPGMVFYSIGEEALPDTVDLSQTFLWVPAGTALDFFIRFSGNLIRSESAGDSSRIKILRDFYIYTSNDSDLKMGISTDGHSWNFNPFGFHYKVNEYYKCTGPGRLEYYRDMSILYDFKS